MSEGFSIAAASYEPTIFQCPKCNETIDSSAEFCRFCGSTVDHEAAHRAAQLLAKINQACSDASYMKSAALTIGVFFLLRLVPFITMLGMVGFYGLLIVIPIWALRWWVKFGALVSHDAEFRRARTTVTICGIVVAALLLLFLILPFLIGVLAALRR
jgi:hypothetical protein